MNPQLLIANALTPALKLLPSAMDTPAARAMLLTIGMQESKLRYRRQINGPARGYWQFESAGLQGVLIHPASETAAENVMTALDYLPNVSVAYTAVEHNDILAVAFARLLLYTLPQKLPGRDETEEAFSQYCRAWRPGHPRPIDWPANYRAAWAIV